MGKRKDKDAFRGLPFCTLIEWNWVSCGLYIGFHYQRMGCHILPVDKRDSVRLSINYHIWKPCVFLPFGASKHNIPFPFSSPNTFFLYNTLIKESRGMGGTGLCCRAQEKLGNLETWLSREKEMKWASQRTEVFPIGFPFFSHPLFYCIFLLWRIASSFHSPLLHKVRLAPTGTCLERLRLRRKKTCSQPTFISSFALAYFSPFIRQTNSSADTATLIWDSDTL